MLKVYICLVNFNMLKLEVLLILFTLGSMVFLGKFCEQSKAHLVYLLNKYLLDNLFTISPTRSSEKCCHGKTVKNCFEAEVNVDALVSGDDVTISDVSLSFHGQVPPRGRVYKSDGGDEAVITHNKLTGSVFATLKTREAWVNIRPKLLENRLFEQKLDDKSF